VGQVDGSLQGGHVRVYQETITLAAQATTDTIVVALPTKGETFLYGVLTSTVSLGTSTIAIGITGTTGKYRAAATFTATDTPTMFGVTSAMSSKLTADETVFITIATAALPGSGTLVVEMYYAQT
jgi:hypothetical protein